MAPDAVDARSEQGLAILEHAFSEGGKVLEFRNGPDGMKVMDITDHHERLQEFWNDNNANSNRENPNGEGEQ